MEKEVEFWHSTILLRIQSHLQYVEWRAHCHSTHTHTFWHLAAWTTETKAKIKYLQPLCLLASYQWPVEPETILFKGKHRGKKNAPDAVFFLLHQNEMKF